MHTAPSVALAQRHDTGLVLGARHRRTARLAAAAVIGAAVLVVTGWGILRVLNAGSSGCGTFAAVYNTVSSTVSKALVGDIYLLDAKFKVCRQLTQDGQSDWPAISPDGRQIAFVSGRGYGVTPIENSNDFQSLYVMDLDGSHVRRLTREFAAAPMWSPHGRYLAYLAGPLLSHIRVRDMKDGTTETISGASRCRPNSWLDERHIAIAWPEPHHPTIIRSVNLDTLREKVLAQVPNYPPTEWTPRFTVSQEDTTGRLVVRWNSTDVTHTVSTGTDGVSGTLTWTTDGNLIWYRHHSGRIYDVLITSARTGHTRVLHQVTPWVPVLADNPALAP